MREPAPSSLTKSTLFMERGGLRYFVERWVDPAGLWWEATSLDAECVRAKIGAYATQREAREAIRQRALNP